MLYLDFKSLFQARNITKPYGVLIKSGFNRQAAYNIAHQKRVNSIKLEHLYKICKAFNCTPNDVIRYAPQVNEHLSEGHSLNKIKGDSLSTKAKEMIGLLSLEDLNAMAEKDMRVV